ncbi:PREDICTED: 28S ribosomal protein S18c, mitochondrial [Nicrophorus vespilloides]|uniref:28S ribosomal protein S18c, mitochondrial n=1 Tax=Nicrophorus vespilloides TaxID=110193 RepID=A0ABM1MB10_NICVS|nr:PREDICTED: 28S ribosomal protein S18c, mitochondrial [Nicrophorus vespilloides]
MSLILRKCFQNVQISSLLKNTRVLMPVRNVGSEVSDADVPKFDMENPFLKEKQQCILCKHKIDPDYKNVKLLSQFQSPYTGRIYGRHITGLCKAKHEKLESEIVKSQSAGLMTVYLKEPCFIKDPKLFDAERPIRPHRF